MNQEIDAMDNILVVEDEANLLKLVSVNLQGRGYQVMEAKNGTEALAHLHEKSPSLIVLDIKLPDFTGWELLNRMKVDPLINANIPVIVMTASITDAHVDMELYPIIAEVIIKPFNTMKLIAAIRQVLAPG